MAILPAWQRKTRTCRKRHGRVPRLLDYAQKIYAITEKGYFEKGLDTTKEILKYHGVIKALKGFDYFSSMHDAIQNVSAIRSCKTC